MKQMPRILLIHHGQGVGGGLIALLGLIMELKLAYEVTVLCIFDSAAVAYLEREGVKVEVVAEAFYRSRYDLFIHSAAGFPSVLRAVRTLKTFLLYLASMYWFAPRVLSKISGSYDVVYLNSLFISDWSRAAKRLGKHVVMHVREPLDTGVLGLRRWVVRRVIDKYVDLVIAISNDNRARLGAHGKSVTVYDPVVLTNRTAGAMHVDTDPSLRYFTYVGGSQRIKGFEQLIESLKYLKPNVRIFFLGYTHELEHLHGWRYTVRRLLSPYARKLPCLKKELESAPNVVRIGLTENVFSYYQRSVAVISAFAVPHASLPVLEALHSGTPLIVSDVEGTGEFVNPETSAMFRNGDAKALAEAINRMSELSEQSLQKMAASCRLRYEELYRDNPSVAALIGQI